MEDRYQEKNILRNIGLTDKTEGILHKNSQIVKKRRKDAILDPKFNVAEAWAEPPVTYEAQSKIKKARESSINVEKSAGNLAAKRNAGRKGAQILHESVPLTGTIYN